MRRGHAQKKTECIGCLGPLKRGRAMARCRQPIRCGSAVASGGRTMDAKLLLLIALLAPILMVAAGIFTHAEKDPPSLQPEQ